MLPVLINKFKQAMTKKSKFRQNVNRRFMTSFDLWQFNWTFWQLAFLMISKFPQRQSITWTLWFSCQIQCHTWCKHNITPYAGLILKPRVCESRKKVHFSSRPSFSCLIFEAAAFSPPFSRGRKSLRIYCFVVELEIPSISKPVGDVCHGMLSFWLFCHFSAVGEWKG